MKTLANELALLRKEFLAPFENCDPIINDFCEDMTEKRSLQMLKTYVFCNSDMKPGEYLSLDFGGSNIRISLYELKEELVLKDTRSFSLRGENYDYTTEEYSITDVFEMIVDKMAEIIDPDKEYLLGHTFSFAMQSLSKNSAKVLSLSKGFALRDAIGYDVNKILKEVIDKKGLKVTPVAVLNDTTATLLSGFMNDRNTSMACIIGTGHNMCFIDLSGEVINMESGGYNSPAIPLTSYDEAYLNKIPNERGYLTEALVGGKNSAKLVNEIYNSLALRRMVRPIPDITPKMMSKVLTENLPGLDELQNCVLRDICEIVYTRAAYLVACEILGVLKFVNARRGTYNVVFDGSVYEKTPFFGERLTQILEKLLPKGLKVTHVLGKDGSGKGAVIACAM